MSGIGVVLRERYEIIAEIGRGGMSTVYLAKDLTLDSYWAVKKVRNTSSVDFGVFKKEVELLASLNYSDIPRIVDRIELAGDYYVVMDFVDGASLARKVLSEGAQPEEDIVEWAKQLCDTLDYLHTVRRNPIVYRDMKPDNVMLTQAGRAKLIDFGIAQECEPGRKIKGKNVGTKGYAAPEQYKGASNILDARSDIYSLGATLYYVATGEVPAMPPKGVPPVRQANPEISEGLAYIIAKCTADDPAERYQSAKEMRADLDQVERSTSGYRKKQSRKLASFVACLALSLVMLGTGFVGYRGMMAQQEDNYQTAFLAATNFERDGDYASAANMYSQAITHKPDDYDTHIYLLNALLPREGDEDYVARTRSAIDEMRVKYLNNEQSPMYHNVPLMYRIVQLCMEVEDTAYAQYAVEYIELIRESPEYRSGEVSAQYIDSYAVVASHLASDVQLQDFGAFSAALQSLEELTDSSVLGNDDRLENYYILIKMYSTYSAQIEGSHQRIYEVAHKGRELLGTIMNDEDTTFTATIAMYQTTAVSLYNLATAHPEDGVKRELYYNSIEWFEYLEDLNVQLDEALMLKKGNAYRGLFDMENTPGGQGSISAEAMASLDTAIEVYEVIVQRNPQSFLGNVCLAQAHFDKATVQAGEEGGNYTAALQYYRAAEAIAGANPDLPVSALSQFSALKQQMQLAGLEV